MSRNQEGKPTMGRIFLFSFLLSLTAVSILVVARIMQFGIEKVRSDWYYHVGFFLFSLVVIFLWIFVASKTFGAGK